MLVLTRRAGQRTIIVVPPSTEETVIIHETLKIQWNNGTVKQGYDGPDYVTIDREELYDVKRESRKQ